MVRYDRRLIIPYLQDVYSVELLYNRVQNDAAMAQNNVEAYSNAFYSDRKPIPPESVSSDNSFGCTGCLVSVLLVIVSVFCIFISESLILCIIGCFLGFGVLMYNKYCYEDFDYRRRELDAHDADMDRYRQRLAEYDARKGERDHNFAMAQKWERELDARNQRVAEVKSLREQIYDANVIAIPYRNVYAAHFLYDYFRSSQSDDLDHALGMFVLEQIKEKLDRIIEQQTEIILAQRVLLAQQREMNQALADDHEREMRYLANLDENAARHNQYLEMINANLNVSNFFAMHDYVKNR